MKKIFLSALILSGFGAIAQQISPSSVPGPVKSTYSSLYPNDKAETWKKQGTFYEADFEKNNKKMGATIDSKGEWVETKEEIDQSALPGDARSYLEERYNNDQNTKVYKVTNAAGGEVRYKACMGDQDLYFDTSGRLVKTEKADAKKADKNKGKLNNKDHTKQYQKEDKTNYDGTNDGNNKMKDENKDDQ